MAGSAAMSGAASGLTGVWLRGWTVDLSGMLWTGPILPRARDWTRCDLWSSRPLGHAGISFLSVAALLPSPCQQAQQWKVQAEQVVPLDPPVAPNPPFSEETQLPVPETPPWPEVNMETTVESHATWLMALEGRMGNAESKLVSCERAAVEFGNRLESKWAVLEILIQEYGQLQKRLETVENQLKEKDVWILSMPPGSMGEVAMVPVNSEASGCFSEQEWGNVEQWPADLHRDAVRSNYEALMSLGQGTDSVLSSAEIPCEVTLGDEPSVQDQADSQGAESPTDFSPAPLTSTPVASSWVKQEDPPCEEDQREMVETNIPAMPNRAKKSLQKQGTAAPDLPRVALVRLEDAFPQLAEKLQISRKGRRGFTVQKKTPTGGSTGPATRSQRTASCPAPGTEQLKDLPEVMPLRCSKCRKHLSSDEEYVEHMNFHKVKRASRLAVQQNPILQPTLSSPDQGNPKPQGGAKSEGNQGLGPDPDPGSLQLPEGPGVQGPHTCVKCRKSFQLEMSLVLHQRVHVRENKGLQRPPGNLGTGQPLPPARAPPLPPGQRPFKCPSCPKDFTRKSRLNDHVRAHTGERLFRCPCCPKEFTKKSKLTDHIRVHTGERPYACTLCIQRFKRRHHLLRHQHVHNRVPACRCSQCGKSFRYEESLKIHLRTACPALQAHRSFLVSPGD
ncbi:zinc finger protein 398 isoform X1 [Alligator mississippiensis]|nr:zinc finger protein 398 isoform X1 [Alligator mississippiensis]